MDAAQSALRVEKDVAGTQGTADYLRGHKFSEHVTKASSDSEASPEGRRATSNFRMADDAGVIALPHESASALISLKPVCRPPRSYHWFESKCRLQLLRQIRRYISDFPGFCTLPPRAVTP